MAEPTPARFKTPAAFRAWLKAHHETASFLLVRIAKAHVADGGITYAQALDEALCYGWIDGMMKRVDEDCYAQRFTPRKKDSSWSLVNIRRVGELSPAGRMHAAGLAAFERRDERKSALYSVEQRRARLAPSFARQLKANPAAGHYFDSQPPGYRRLAAWWVMSAKRADTRARRFATLLEDCAAGRRIGVVGGRPGR